MKTINNENDLDKSKMYLAWMPQVPCKAFYVEVESYEQAKSIRNVLANYDLFQLENNIKPDYCNASDLVQFDEEEQEWLTWTNEEGYDFHEVLREEEISEESLTA